MNLKHLKLLLDNDERLVKKFLGVFIRETPKQLKALGAALKTNQLKEVALIAHAIKSQLRYLGLDNLAAVAQQLEKGAENNTHPGKLKLYYRKLHHEVHQVIAGLL
jgi:HPt (histidine-containing phosphotransfer) domain-containing protein